MKCREPTARGSCALRDRGKGKRGGYRIITSYSGKDLPVFLLSMFAKNERSDLNQEEKNELSKLLKLLAQTYRKRVRK